MPQCPARSGERKLERAPPHMQQNLPLLSPLHVHPQPSYPVQHGRPRRRLPIGRSFPLPAFSLGQNRSARAQHVRGGLPALASHKSRAVVSPRRGGGFGGANRSWEGAGLSAKVSSPGDRRVGKQAPCLVVALGWWRWKGGRAGQGTSNATWSACGEVSSESSGMRQGARVAARKCLGAFGACCAFLHGENGTSNPDSGGGRKRAGKGMSSLQEIWTWLAWWVGEMEKLFSDVQPCANACTREIRFSVHA